MPTDGSGVYSLPAGYLATAGLQIVTSQHNPIFEDVASAITARLMASGANPMTGPLKAADGTVGAPSIAFTGAPSSGLYRTTTGIGVTIAGVRVAEIGPGGISKGAKYIGEIFDFVGSAAPVLCVFPVGQVLNRAAYADLWTLALTEIAAGNLFFNTGDGSTTFGIGDLRGRGTIARDNMGGSAAGRTTVTTMTPDGNTIGAAGGTQTKTLITANLPPQTPAGTIGGSVTTVFRSYATPASGPEPFAVANASGSGATSAGNSLSATFTGTAAPGQTSTPFSAMPPSMITQKAMFAGA